MPDQVIPDGTAIFSGGHNAANDPDKIREDQYALGINVSCETGSLTPRWGIVEDVLDFSNTGDHERESGFSISWEKVFNEGKFQSFIEYQIGPDAYNIYIVSGYIFLILLADMTVQVLNPDDPVSVNADRINSSPAGDYLVIFDWPDRPFILDGILLRRSDPSQDEVPVSVLGTNNQNRLAIGNAGIDWTASDPSGLTPTAPLTFTEVNTAMSPYVGDVYQIPTASRVNSNITAMGYLQVLDKSTEIGSLLVATKQSITAYPTFLPRSQWVKGANNESQVFGSLLLATGIVGQRAQVNINSEFIFLSPDEQVYALTMARNDQYKWSNTPISREVKNFLGAVDPTIAFVSVCATYKNKIFVTCNPYRVNCASAEGIPQTDYVSPGVVVVETDNMATLSGQTPPVWAGVWTGVDFLDMRENADKLYIAAKKDGRNRMFHFDRRIKHDVFEGKRTNIRSVIDTREYSNQAPTRTKQLHSFDLGLRDIKETLTVESSYRSSILERYVPWKEITYTAPYYQCEAFPAYPEGLQPQGIRDLNSGGPPSECDPALKQDLSFYKGVQLRLVLEGQGWKLDYIELKGKVLEQSMNNPYCLPDPKTPVPRQCFDIWAKPKGTC